MRGKFRPHHILEVVLLFIALAGFSASNSKANENSKYLDAVREFADMVLKHGRDTYGPKHTPLFVDGLNIHTHEPVKWIDPDDTKWILSNLASQQNLFRTLDGLSTITGDPKYRQAAVEAIEYAFENMRSPNGLLYWGIEVAYDAQKDSIHNPESRHVLKSQHPYYELMWEVDAEATRQFIEAFWAAHIINWSNLDMNRIGRPFNAPLEKPWIQKYTGGPVFFQSVGRSMLTTGSDLFCAAGLLSKLSGDEKPLVWAKRLAYRYVETRNPHIGISGHGYTRKEIDAVQEQIGEDFGGRPILKRMLVPPVPGLGDPDIREQILGYLIITPGIEYSIITGPWTSSMVLGDFMGNDGGDFIKLGLEEFTALGKEAYRSQDNVFIPMINDGTSLEGYVCKKDGPLGWRGLKFKAIPAVPMDFWAYALAYRITGDQFMWRMVRNIASGHGLGNIGITPEKQHQLKTTTDCWQPFTLLGFLELYRKTGNQAFLQIAQTIGDNLLVHRFHKGFFVPSDKHIYTKFDAIEPLILLNLHAALKASSVSAPIVWPGRSIFNVAYRHRRLAMDNSLIYTLTDSLEPPKSLLEAATEGDLDGVKAMIARGAKVNARDQFNASALHYASQQGHIEVADLLIAKGARVNAGPRTPLHYAAENGHKDMIELLIVKGADINARNPLGETPLYYAVEKGHKEIAELLIIRGADVNATRGWLASSTPIHSTVRTGRKDIFELLVSKGADVNSKNVASETPLHHAARFGRKDIAELLIVKGAVVNAKNNNGQTPVDIAVSRNRNEVVKLLIEKGADVSLHSAAGFGDLARVKSLIEEGADVNAENLKGDTPIEIALMSNRKDVVELLVEKGADLSIYVAAYVGDIDKVKGFIETGTSVNGEPGRGHRTPLYWAVRNDHKDVAKLLIEKGADISSVSLLYYVCMHGHRDLAEFLIQKGADANSKNWGDTPSHYAVWGGHVDVLELLLAHGADASAKDNAAWSLLHYAAGSGSMDMTKILLDKDADVNAKENKGGQTPLHRAVEKGHITVAELLIANGADVNAKENEGKTALSVAKDKGHTEIVELLRKHGAIE